MLTLLVATKTCQLKKEQIERAGIGRDIHGRARDGNMPWRGLTMMPSTVARRAPLSAHRKIIIITREANDVRGLALERGSSRGSL